MSANRTIRDMVANLSSSEIACLKTLTTGAMSYGSISLRAHMTIAKAVNLLAMAVHKLDPDSNEDIKTLRKMGMQGTPLSNSGEGGELAKRDNTIYESRGRQVASGRFGVKGHYLAHAGLIQIKVNQAAKPGLGGELPGFKVTAEIAEARGTQAGTTLISPPPHHDIYSIEQLKELIHNLRSANPDADISVKLAAGEGIGVISAGVVKAGANHISIAGLGGGTGAAPLIAKYEFVLPWETALAEVHQKLTSEGLRSSVKLTVSGGIQTGDDTFMALLLGADYTELGTTILVSLGCIMAEHCHDGKCPAGIATTDEDNVKRNFAGLANDVAQFLIRIAKSMSARMAQFGLTDPTLAIGRTDLLKVAEGSPVKGLETLLAEMKNPYPDFAPLSPPKGSSDTEEKIIARMRAGEKEISAPAQSCDLSFGARINYHSVTDNSFAEQLKSPVTLRFQGIAVGQSFGFLAPKNLILIAERSNDNTAKSLDGAEIYVQQTAGNQALYGATSGLFCTRYVGDRAAVRNSGAILVAEGIGDMAANFMTGGEIILLGSPRYYRDAMIYEIFKEPVKLRKPVGPNFGAGFTGGYIYLPRRLYEEMKADGYLSTDTLNLIPQPLTAEDKPHIALLLKKYSHHIDSPWVKDMAERQDFVTDLVKLDPRIKNPAFKLVAKPNSAKRAEAPLPPLQKPKSLRATASPVPTVLTSPATSPAMEKDACGVGAYFDLTGKISSETTNKVITMLERFKHRGATGIDPNTGDGCGIAWFGLESFFAKLFPKAGLQKGNHAVVSLFAGKTAEDKQSAFHALTQALEKEGLFFFKEHVRKLPTRREVLGKIGQQQEPDNYQCVVLKPADITQGYFEKKLARARLYFELTEPQNPSYAVKPHVASASSYHVVYKTLATENNIRHYFQDFQDTDFKASGGVDHSRFSTNVLSSIGGVHPHNNILANNGENNALAMIADLLTNHPAFKSLFGTTKIDLSGFSDSRIMSIYLSALALMDYPLEKIVASTIQAYDPLDETSRLYYNLFATRFVGPNASVIMLKNKIAFIRDENGFRPLRGMANKTEFYSGSELGAVDMAGEIFDLPPGKILLLDLTTGIYSLYETDAKTLAFQKEQLQRLRTCEPPEDQKPCVSFTQADFRERQLRAGWNAEFDKMQMQPLFKGEKNISSMGDQGPIEAAVRGQFPDVNEFLKGKFSQVTNPPQAKEQESKYMLPQTSIGPKPGLHELDTKMVDGYKLDTPVLTNEEMSFLQEGLGDTASIIDTTLAAGFEPMSKEDFLLAIERIKLSCIDLVKNGTSTLILSDLQSSKTRMTIPPSLITSIVHDALLKTGLRREVSLIVQSSQIRTGSDTAKAISFGADAVNPYLPFCLKESRQHFRDQLNQELLGRMARMGITSVSAYRGVRGFTGYGMSRDLANLFGIHSELDEAGGFGIQKMLQAAWNNHHFPNKIGLGKWDKDSEPQANRLKKWDQRVTRRLLNSRSIDPRTSEEVSDDKQQENFDEYEKAAKAIGGQPRNYLEFAKATHWSKSTPMPVCIIGGGAAGFYQAQALLDSGLPVKITIIEKKFVNKFGLLGDAVSPLHIGTKNQSKILRATLNDPRVEYVGGIEIGKDLTMAEIQKDYPCIIDCSGAEMNNRLNVPGEALATPASEVYKSYNGEFNPTREINWPFTMNSTNTSLGIIGNGNVAADAARILLIDPDVLSDEADKHINSEFLTHLRQESPRIVHVFARNNPLESKMSLESLKELAELKDVEISTSFDMKQIAATDLTDTKKELFEFFNGLTNRRPAECNKKLVFHFDMVPQSLHANEEKDGIQATFVDKNKDSTFSITARNFITAIGTSRISQAQVAMYQSGWAAGKGGTLPLAENSANQTAERIQEDFAGGKFPYQSLGWPAWRLKRPIDKKALINILNWLEDKGEITQENFEEAKYYQRYSLATSLSGSAMNLASRNRSWVNLSDADGDDPDSVIAHSATGDTFKVRLKSSHSSSMLNLLKDTMGDKAPKHSCGGKQTCGDCAVKVSTSSPIKRKNKEINTLKANDLDPSQYVLSCAHTTDIEDMGSVFSSQSQGMRRH